MKQGLHFPGTLKRLVLLRRSSALPGPLPRPESKKPGALHGPPDRLARPIWATCLLAISPIVSVAAGIPEPDWIMYGLVTNVRSNANIHLGFGTLNCTLQPSAGQPVLVSTTLTNLYDQLCYILRIPCETETGGFPASSNTVRLSSAATTVNRSQLTWNGYPIKLVLPAQANASISILDRGRIERVDLEVSAPLTDSDGNGLPDAWELTYFGHIGVNPNADPDGDGLSNLAEYRAGTSPLAPNSAFPFQFVGIRCEPKGGICLEWYSASNSTYTLQRSSDLMAGFYDLATNITATPAINSFVDTNTLGAGSYFYRLHKEP